MSPRHPSALQQEAARKPEPLVKEPKETRVWTCSDGTTKTRLEDAKAHELKLSFNKLVRPYDMAGRHADQPIPLPNGLRDRDDLWRWIEEHGHDLFPWLGIYVASVPRPGRMEVASVPRPARMEVAS